MSPPSAALYTLEGSCDELRSKVERMETDNKKARSRFTKGCVFSILCFVGGVTLAAVVPPLGLLLLLGFFYFLVVCFKNKTSALDERKLHTITRFISIVSADVPAKNRLKATLDLRPAAPKDGAHSQTWLVLRVPLADGNAARFDITLNTKRKSKSKRKYTKVRERMRETLVLRMRVNPSRYPDLSQLPSDLNGAAPPPTLQLKQVQTQEQSVTVQFCTPLGIKVTPGQSNTTRLVGGDELLGALVWLYRGLKVGKARALAGRV